MNRSDRFENSFINNPASNEVEKVSRLSSAQEMAQTVLKVLGIPELIKISNDYMRSGVVDELPADKLP